MQVKDGSSATLTPSYEQRPWSRGALIATSALLVSLVALIGWERREYCMDDAFIFARYARNLATTGQWAYNLGDAVFATTSVLWTLLLVPVELAHLPVVPSMLVLYGASLAALAAGVFVATQPLGRGAAVLCALLVLVGPLLWQSMGLETALALALVVWAIVVFTRKSEITSGALVGLSMLARPDAALLGVLLSAQALRTNRRIPWRLVTAACMVCTPWWLYAFSTFGTILPATLRAKSLQTSIGWWSEQPPFVIAALTSIPLGPAALIGIVAALVPSRPHESRQALLPSQLIVGYGVGHAVAYSALRFPAGYVWYYTPLALAASQGTVVALVRLVGPLRAYFMRRGRASLADGAPYVAAAVGALLVIVNANALYHESARYRLSVEYRHAADWLSSHSAPGDVFAATEIGYLGYYANRRVIDMHGLIHPAAQEQIAKHHHDWWRSRAPRFVVVHVPPWFAEPDLPVEATSERGSSYVLRHTVESEEGTGGVAVWERGPGAE